MDFTEESQKCGSMTGHGFTLMPADQRAGGRSQNVRLTDRQGAGLHRFASFAAAAFLVEGGMFLHGAPLKKTPAVPISDTGG